MITSTHGDAAMLPSSLVCTFCSITFPDSTLYFLHKGCHCDSNPWKCNICGEQCCNVYEFNSHLLSKSHQWLFAGGPFHWFYICVCTFIPVQYVSTSILTYLTSIIFMDSLTNFVLFILLCMRKCFAHAIERPPEAVKLKVQIILKVI